MWHKQGGPTLCQWHQWLRPGGLRPFIGKCEEKMRENMKSCSPFWDRTHDPWISRITSRMSYIYTLSFPDLENL